MTPPPPRDLRLSGSRSGDDVAWREGRVRAWAGAFVALGVALRLVRYALGYPLWGDEAFLASNLLDRDFAGLMRPLDYTQVCPLLFLWAEKAMSLALGFSVWSLRLIPTAASIAGLFLTWHVASRLLKGPAVILSVAILAVAFYPIRHGGEIKPYSVDFLAALGLIALAVEWLRTPERAGPLWGLVAAGPLAVGFSNPSIFVAAAVGLVLMAPVVRSGRPSAIVALMAYGALTVGAFGVLHHVVNGPQSDSVMATMRDYWSSAFPPQAPLPLVTWLLRVHTSHMFSYPAGGEGGASTLTTGLVVAGIVAMVRRGSRVVLSLYLVPFALGLAAAFLGRYPYGGSARTMQYVAPAILLLAGLGAAALLSRVPSVAWNRRAHALSIAVFAMIGLGLLAWDVTHPYKSVYDRTSRDYARQFWAELGNGAEIACARTDLGVALDPKGWRGDRTALYLCHRAIFAPGPPRLDRLAEDRPLRAVVFDERPGDRPGVDAWLEQMGRAFELRSRTERWANRGVISRAGRYQDHYIVYEFVPRRVASTRRPSSSR